MTRLEAVRTVVDSVLMSQENLQIRRAGYIHLYGVSDTSALLALRRGLDAELAAVSGMLHDIYTYRTGFSTLHAHSGGEDVRVILRDLNSFSPGEQQLICSAVFHHSDKGRLDGPYQELLKDADLLQHYLHDSTQSFPPAAAERIRATAAELGLPPIVVTMDRVVAAKTAPDAGRRLRMADFAEELAARPLVGDARQSGPDVYPLIRYFPGARPDQGWDWCASFVYHCAMQSGLTLPIRHPQASCRFAAVLAWLEWAKLPEIGFFHAADEAGFQPARGDLVICDGLVSDLEHDHIGVVLGCDLDRLTTAEGNIENRSGIFQRDRYQHIHGFIRVDDTYQYAEKEWPHQ